MIDPSWLGSVAPIIAGAGLGLIARRAIAANEARHAHSSTEPEPPAEPQQPPASPRPRVRMSVPAGAVRR